MEFEKKLSSLAEFIAKIQDPQINTVFIELLNIIEELNFRNKMLQQKNQQLRDEINRLKGEHGKPDIKPNNRTDSKNISSETERNKKKKWKKNAKKPQIPIDTTVHCPIDKNNLPSDAVFKYTDTVIGQDIIFKRNNTLYLIDVYYSPSEKKTYRAALPAGYSGYHGNGLKSFTLALHNVCDVTSNKILDLLHSIGCEISKGSLSSILLGNTAWLYNEKRDILNAGLAVSYAQVDATGSRVRGTNHYTQIICNEYFTAYTTLQNKSRLDVLAAFQGVHDKNQLQLIYNEETIRLLAIADVCENDRALLGNVFHHNVSELGARQKARKRDISLHTMTSEGTKVQDAWMTIVQTAKKIGVNIYDYIMEKISNPSSQQISLAELIYQKAGSP